MLAARDITVEIGGGTIRLRPTLRAAMRLERQFDGFAELFRLLTEGSVTAATAILAEHADPVPNVTPSDAIRLAPALVDHLAQVLDMGEAKAGSSGAPISFAELFARLFGMGTGVIGWTPAETWAASPAEIIAAYDARRELLAAIFGGGEGDEDKQSVPNFKRDPDASAVLRALA